MNRDQLKQLILEELDAILEKKKKKRKKRKKYPACRPTPAACRERGRGKTWGKKAAKGKK